LETISAAEQLRIIKSMVDRGRRETAESGHFFIWIGILSIVGVFAIRAIETAGRGELIVPMLAALTIGNGVLAYMAIVWARRDAGARSYATRICYSVWLACGIASIITVLPLPLLRAIPWDLVPVIVALIIGVGMFSSGVVLESRSITLSSAAWWGGAVAMALMEGGGRAYVMAAMIVIGWILPGAILNRNYRQVRDRHEH